MRKLSPRHVPTFEEMERRALLATYNLNFASFTGTIVRDTTDQTLHTAWAFPGMQYTVQSNLPLGNWMSFGNVTYTTSVSNLDPALTTYNTTTGRYGLTTSVPHPAVNSSFDRVTLAAPKDEVTFTLTVTAQARRYNSNPPVYDTLVDTLTIKVESPQVTMHQVSDETAPGVPATPLWFGTISKSGGTAGPDPSGTMLGFMMASGNPPQLSRKWAGFWATVTNDTHYDLKLGYIQTLDKLSYSYIYTTGASGAAEGQDLLDIVAGDTDYWYFWRRVPPGGAIQFPNMTLSNNDSPVNAWSYTNTSNGTGYLTTIYMDIQASTHLAVGGGYVPNGGPGVAGYPIALSTARWHLRGQAINTVNDANPNGADRFTTLSLLNWSVQMASGAGPSPATLPGPNVPWLSNGDLASKYLTWSGNSAAVLAPYIASGLGAGSAEAISLLDVTSPSAALGRMPRPWSGHSSLSSASAFAHWDAALEHQTALSALLDEAASGPIHKKSRALRH